MDIVEWLRKEAELVALDRLSEAADEIEALSAIIVYYVSQGWPSYSERERQDKIWKSELMDVQSRAFARHLKRTTKTEDAELA